MMQVVGKDVDAIEIVHQKRLETLALALQLRKTIPYDHYLPDLIEYIPWNEEEVELQAFNLHGKISARIKSEEELAMWIFEQEALNRIKLSDFLCNGSFQAQETLQAITAKICALDVAQHFGEGLKIFLPVTGLWERAVVRYKRENPNTLSEAVRDQLSIFCQAHLKQSSSPLVSIGATETVIRWLTDVALVCMTVLLGYNCESELGYALSLSEFFSHLRNNPATSSVTLSMKVMSDLYAALTSSPLVTVQEEMEHAEMVRSVLFSGTPAFSGLARLQFHPSKVANPSSKRIGTGIDGDEGGEVYRIVVYRDTLFAFSTSSAAPSNSSNLRSPAPHAIHQAFSPRIVHQSPAHEDDGALRLIVPLSVANVQNQKANLDVSSTDSSGKAVPLQRRAHHSAVPLPGALAYLDARDVVAAPGVIDVLPQEHLPALPVLHCVRQTIESHRAAPTVADLVQKMGGGVKKSMSSSAPDLSLSIDVPLHVSYHPCITLQLLPSNPPPSSSTVHSSAVMNVDSPMRLDDLHEGEEAEDDFLNRVLVLHDALEAALLHHTLPRKPRPVFIAPSNAASSSTQPQTATAGNAVISSSSNADPQKQRTTSSRPNSPHHQQQLQQDHQQRLLPGQHVASPQQQQPHSSVSSAVSPAAATSSTPTAASGQGEKTMSPSSATTNTHAASAPPAATAGTSPPQPSPRPRGVSAANIFAL